MKAMLFSAGLGTRFKPWTDKHPKALAQVNKKSLLQRNIEYLLHYGIKDIVVNVHHYGDQVKKAIKDHKGWGANIMISDETNELLETGGGLLHAREFFEPGKSFLTCNVDILTDLDLYQLAAFHKTKNALITFGVTDRKTSRYLLFDQDERLCGWRNTNDGKERISRPSDVLIQKAYSCVVLFEYGVFDLMENHGFSGNFSLIDVYLKLAPHHLIMGYDHSGDHLVDVGKPSSVIVAEAVFP